MIDFKEEINKYVPVLEMEEVGEAANNDELKDVMDLLQRITDQITSSTFSNDTESNLNIPARPAR